MADAARIQERIAYLKKVRPGDPEIAQLQQKLKTLTAAPAPAPIQAQPVDPNANAERLQAEQDRIAAEKAAAAAAQPAPQPATQPTPDPAAGFGAGVASGVGQGATPAQTPGAAAAAAAPPVGSSVGLEAPVQDLLGSQVGLGALGAQIAYGLLGGMPQQPYNPNSLKNGIPTANSADRQKVEDSVYANLTRDLDQNFSRAMEDKKQELADRGIPVGSAAYSTEMDRLQKGYDRQKLEARNQAIQSGGQEMLNQFGMGLQAHNTEMGDYQSGWSFPTSVANSLVGLGTAPLGSFADLSNVFGGIQQRQADRAQDQAQFEREQDQQMEQFLQSLGLDQAKLDFARKQWKDEKAKRAAEVAALNRSNRGGGRSGGSSEDSGPGFGGAIT